MAASATIPRRSIPELPTMPACSLIALGALRSVRP